MMENAALSARIAVSHPTSPNRGDTVRCGSYVYRADEDEDGDGLTLCYIGPRVASVMVRNNGGNAIANGAGHTVYYDDTAQSNLHLVTQTTGSEAVAGFGTNKTGASIANNASGTLVVVFNSSGGG